jgi:hypothetical protein
MLQQRQVNDIEQLIEISYAPAVSPGLIGSAFGATSVTVSCVLGNAFGVSKATFQLGDELEVQVPAAAAPVVGLVITALPTTTPGQCTISFVNCSGGNITPTSATYVIIAKRYTPTVI